MSGVTRAHLCRALLLVASLAPAWASTAAPPATAAEAEAASPPAVSLESPEAVKAREQTWDTLVRLGIDADLHGRHDEADATWDRLEAIDAHDPEPWLRRVDTVYWRHWYDESQALSQESLRRLLERSRSLAEAGLRTNEDDLRSRWMLGEVLMQEARLEAMSGNYMRAGTMGERGRNELERLLEVDPHHPQAGYPLGLYYYFSSLMPQFVQKMSWLWFIPKGDRDKGLELLGEIQRGDSVYSPSASMVLMAIHTYHSPTDIPAAVRLSEHLHASYPENAILHFELLEVLLKAGRHERMMAEALELEQRVGESKGVTGRAMLARIWRARAAIELGRTDEARKVVFEIEDADPRLPEWGRVWLWVVRGHLLDVEGDRAGAVAAYEKVLSFELDDFYGERPMGLARSGIAAPYQPGAVVDGPIITSRD